MEFVAIGFFVKKERATQQCRRVSRHEGPAIDTCLHRRMKTYKHKVPAKVGVKQGMGNIRMLQKYECG